MTDAETKAVCDSVIIPGDCYERVRADGSRVAYTCVTVVYADEKCVLYRPHHGVNPYGRERSMRVADFRKYFRCV